MQALLGTYRPPLGLRSNVKRKQMNDCPLIANYPQVVFSVGCFRGGSLGADDIYAFWALTFIALQIENVLSLQSAL